MKTQTLILIAAGLGGLWLWQRQRGSTYTSKTAPATPPYMPTVTSGSTWETLVNKPSATAPLIVEGPVYRDHEGL